MDWITLSVASAGVCPDVEKDPVFIVSGIRLFAARRISISIVCVCHKSVYKSSGHFRGISLTLLASRTSKCNIVLFRPRERKELLGRWIRILVGLERTKRANGFGKLPVCLHLYLHALVKGHSEKWASMMEIFICMGQQYSAFSSFFFSRSFPSLEKTRLFIRRQQQQQTNSRNEG